MQFPHNGVALAWRVGAASGRAQRGEHRGTKPRTPPLLAPQDAAPCPQRLHCSRWDVADLFPLHLAHLNTAPAGHPLLAPSRWSPGAPSSRIVNILEAQLRLSPSLPSTRRMALAAATPPSPAAIADTRPSCLQGRQALPQLYIRGLTRDEPAATCALASAYDGACHLKLMGWQGTLNHVLEGRAARSLQSCWRVLLVLVTS